MRRLRHWLGHFWCFDAGVRMLTREGRYFRFECKRCGYISKER